jgi:hypothetical protein
MIHTFRMTHEAIFMLGLTPTTDGLRRAVQWTGEAEESGLEGSFPNVDDYTLCMLLSLS